MKRMARMGAALALCTAFASCAANASGGAEQAPDGEGLSGQIVAVEPAPPGTRLTVSIPSPADEDGRAVVLVPAGAEIRVQGGDRRTRPGTVADLVPGARVFIRHTGVVLRSLPPQYTATHIQVLAR